MPGWLRRPSWLRRPDVPARAWRLSATLGGGLLGATVAVTAAWAVDAAMHDGRVVRNVRLGDTTVGGMDAAEVRAVVAGFAAEVRGAQVVVDAPGGGFEASAAELGLEVDPQRTTDAVMRVGRAGSIPARVAGWLLSPLAPRRAPVAIDVSEGDVYAIVAARDPGPRRPAVEPTIRGDNEGVRAVAGRPGRGIDAADVIDALPRGVGRTLPVRVKVDRGAVAPRFTVRDAEALAGEAERLTRKGLSLSASSATARATADRVRRWVTAEASKEGLLVALDGPRVLDDLRELLDDAGVKPTDAKFSVSGGAVRIIPGKDGTGCCAERAVEIIERALRRGDRVVTRLPLRPVEPEFDTEDARALGVVEPIGSFTTRHKAGEPRVKNIHRIADLMQGQLIKPGRVLSVNEAVGRRTVARGFVNAPVIEEGKFEEDVGGGVSQYATTLFNAAFFAGLEFTEYQSHSIYISRYPYGREATLSYPHPDLRIRNPSRNGVVVWATYSDTAITVTLYGTKFADVTQTGQTKSMQGSCTVVRTRRLRVFTDGARKEDSIRATYRAQEGVNCNQPTTTSSSTTTTTTTPASTSTTARGGSSTTTSTTPTSSPPSTMGTSAM